ncbi:MAG: NAD-dependent dehydratase [Bdellovibrionales bacterium RIFOXYD1_FULL_53_11]|nr:MAG: NAD-dependent dehydratase [Bdellovibrionales bacterium RIFOXYD1_FULL_53_11]
MKKVLVTGAAGFIGSHLVEFLVKCGYQVRSFVRYNSTNTWGWLDKISKSDSIEIFRGDLSEFDSVNNAVSGMDMVFHLGALIGIPYSYVSPKAYLRTNVDGTYNILEASRIHGVKRVLITSTSEVYGTAEYVPIDEKHPLKPQSPYAASKIGADNLALSYFYSFNTPVTVVRPFNTYGPRQSARAVIPSIIIQLLSGNPELKLGSLDPVRDFTYVEDTVSAMKTIAEHEEFIGKTVNVNAGEAVSIGELVGIISGILKINPSIITDRTRIRPTNSEVRRLVGNSDFLRKCSTWKPRLTLPSGLETTVKWFQDNANMYKSNIYNV